MDARQRTWQRTTADALPFGKAQSWPKFEHVTKKVPTPRTLELLGFDEKSTFGFFALF
jgi:hypothetical protein